ncbi:MAG: hypothetical protein RR363_07700 [Rikenellaceae bacterium]
MKKSLFCLLTICSCLMLKSAFGQDENTGYEVYNKFQRSALYTIMLEQDKKSQVKYADDIKAVFLTLETPDKFDDHDLEDQKIIKVDDNNKRDSVIASFLKEHEVAKKLVAKWYNRHVDGSFNMELVKQRGFYNADELEKMRAAMSVRGIASLTDAGEELIGNTFVLVNDIRYFDKEKAGGIAMAIFSGLASVANAYAATTDDEDQKTYANIAASTAQLGALMSDILAKGFNVKITSYLYKLDWDKESAAKFYEQFYTETPDSCKTYAFDNKHDMFSLSYIGQQYIKAIVQSTKFSAKTNEELIRKTLYKAIDKSIVELQRQHEIFRSKTPVESVNKKIITAAIGVKEGIDPKLKYYVYERLLNPKTGEIKYRQVCVTKPVKEMIWDNTYMAANDKDHGNITINATQFKIIGKGSPQVGMLIHEGPINNTEVRSVVAANKEAQ